MLASPLIIGSVRYTDTPDAPRGFQAKSSMNDVSRRHPRAADRHGDAAGGSGAHGAPRRAGRFANGGPHPPLGSRFWRWPRGGPAAFAERWRVAPDFRCGLDAAGNAARPVVWWLGHATVLLRIGGLHVIT